VKEWWSENWQVFFSGSGVMVALIAAVGGITVAIINRHKSAKAQPQPKKRNLNFSRGQVFEDLSNYQKALECYIQAANEYEPSSMDRASALFSAGGMHGRLCQYNESIECYLETLAIYYVNDMKWTASSIGMYICIAGAYFAQGQDDTAISIALTAYKKERIRNPWKPKSLYYSYRSLRDIYMRSWNKKQFDDWLAQQYIP